MEKFIIKDKNCNRFLTIDRTNNATITTNMGIAQSWDDYKKANNFLVNNCSKFVNYEVVKVVNNTNNSENLIYFSLADDLNVEKMGKNGKNSETLTDEEWENGISELFEFSEDLNKLFSEDSSVRQRKLQEKLSEIDKKIVDVEHFIEFHNLNGVDGFKIYKKLQNLFKERRQIKDYSMILTALTPIKGGLVNLNKAMNGLNHRKYSPRSGLNLFEKEG